MLGVELGSLDAFLAGCLPLNREGELEVLRLDFLASGFSSRFLNNPDNLGKSFFV